MVHTKREHYTLWNYNEWHRVMSETLLLSDISLSDISPNFRSVLQIPLF